MVIQRFKMSKDSTFFGWHSAFCVYGLKDFAKDSIIPAILSLLLVIVGVCSGADTYKMLGMVFSLGMSIIPVMISLLIAAYAILLSMFCSKTANDIAGLDGGKELLAHLNSDFAVSIYVSIVSILVILPGSFIHGLGLLFEYSSLVNSIVSFGVLYLLFFSVLILKDLVIAIYDIGQVAIHYK